MSKLKNAAKVQFFFVAEENILVVGRPAPSFGQKNQVNNKKLTADC
ncbi:MAG: hypothetical protein J6X98_06705 [Bacteroidales bacterium]|nr:hypothetical protein [Bacteroidales bacterium]